VNTWADAEAATPKVIAAAAINVASFPILQFMRPLLLYESKMKPQAAGCRWRRPDVYLTG
jgi:hypothetical protein